MQQSSDEQPFRYTGRRYDRELRIYYYRARFYAPSFGRFMQTDPIGYEDNMNLYGYTGNDPVNGTDPSGKFCIPCAVVAPEVLGGAIILAGAYGIKKTNDLIADRMQASYNGGTILNNEAPESEIPADQPQDLEEQLAVEEAKGKMEGGPGEGVRDIGSQLDPDKVRNPDIASGAKQKLGTVHKPLDPESKPIDVHGYRDPKTGEVTDTKIKRLEEKIE